MLVNLVVKDFFLSSKAKMMDGWLTTTQHLSNYTEKYHYAATQLTHYSDLLPSSTYSAQRAIFKFIKNAWKKMD